MSPRGAERRHIASRSRVRFVEHALNEFAVHRHPMQRHEGFEFLLEGAPSVVRLLRLDVLDGAFEILLADAKCTLPALPSELAHIAVSAGPLGGTGLDPVGEVSEGGRR